MVGSRWGEQDHAWPAGATDIRFAQRLGAVRLFWKRAPARLWGWVSILAQIGNNRQGPRIS